MLIRALCIPVMLAAAAAVHAETPMTRLSVVVTTQGGHPIDRASVVIRFVEGHSVVKLGKAVRTTYELRTDEHGEAKIPEIPQGKIRIQVIAKGYQTFGKIFDITAGQKTVLVKLNPPQQQYSAHQ
jgi:Carboxypeptidase regulatory-like domain